MKQTPRVAALKVLLRVEQEAGYSNLALASVLGKERFDAAERAFTRALVYGVLENRLAIDYVLTRFSSRLPDKLDPDVRSILRLGVCQLGFLGGVSTYAAVNESVALERRPHLRGYINGVLRAVSRALEKGPLPLPDREKDPEGWLEAAYSCPRALFRAWRKDYGEERMMGILESLHGKTRHYARVNTLRISREGLCALLGLGAQEEPFLPGCVRFDELPPLEECIPFLEGLFHLQGWGSQFCCEALGARPGEQVLDLCAAPGGKSFTIAEEMGNSGGVIACDLHENRLSLIRTGAERLGISIIEARQNDASVSNPGLGLFDRVLCDVPCSGLGVLRSKPEIRYRPVESYAALPPLQLAILREGATHLRQSGTLIYSTCTLSRAENEDVAEHFLSEHGGFEPLSLPGPYGGGHMATLFPQEDRPEGFFVAGFRRRI